MKGSVFFNSAVFTFGILSCGVNSKESGETLPPNIILILADDQGWGDLSFNGNTNLHTPNIDYLAKRGARFEQFYVCPVCSPTRAEMLTGRYYPRGGVYSTSAGGERLDLDETTIGDIFKEAGYVTAAFGKWHNGMQYPYHPNGRGFDEFYGFCSGHWGNYFSPMLEHNGKIVKGEGYIIDDLTDHAIDFMQKHKDQPFLLYLPFNTPHGPMQVPGEWWNKFEDKALEKHHRDPEKEDPDFTRAALAMSENIDFNVGRITDMVKNMGIEERTIILYFTDNGPNSWRWNGGMKGKKGSTDEGGVKSPLFIQWAGVIEEGKVIKQNASAIDLLPTLADLAGISYATHKPLDGKSLKTLLLEDEPEWEERLIYNLWGNNLSVRSQRYRLDKDNGLYDMENDPGQLTDISGKEPEIRENLLKAKRKWESEVLSELDKEERPFPVGHPEYDLTQLPARDGIAHGNIERSNRFPNCSYFTRWTGIEDYISWDVEVLKEGDYDVTLYYTCKPENIGGEFELKFKGNGLKGILREAHDPPPEGMEHDRVPRKSSYVKDFRPLKMGTIYLEKGRGSLELRALSIPGSELMDFRLMMFKRVNNNR